MLRAFEWCEGYSVGIPKLDSQHRQIIDILTELRKCVHTGASELDAAAILQALEGYSQVHLTSEELVLRVRQYPGYTDHKAEHDAYRRKIASFYDKVQRPLTAIRISNFLTEWWRYHILSSDREYARFFRRRITS